MMKGFQLLILLIIVTILSSCSLFQKEPYCFLETNVGTYCAIDQETYESIEIEFGAYDIMLSDLVDDDRFSHSYTILDEVYFIPKEFDVVYKGNYTFSRKESDGKVIGFQKGFEIRKVEDTLNDNREMSVMIKDSKEYCMGTVSEYNRHYLYFEDGTAVDISYLNFHNREISLETYGIKSFDCKSETIMRGDTEFITRFRNEDVHIVAHQYPVWVNFIGSYYSDNDEIFCEIGHRPVERNFLKVGDDYIKIQDALDNNLLEGKDLKLYSIESCGKERSKGMRLLMSSNLLVNGVPQAFDIKTETTKLDGVKHFRVVGYVGDENNSGNNSYRSISIDYRILD